MTALAVVGLGSRGLSVLERIVTLARGPVRVEVVDPVCTGAGVHEPDQPDYLLLNTTAGQVSMFPDAATVGAATGPPGPSLYDWVTARGLRIAADGYTVGTTGRPVRDTDFLPRRVLGEYLGWFLADLLRRAPSTVDIRLHRAEAVDLDPGVSVTLAGGERLAADHAFLTTGYAGAARGPYPLPAVVAHLAPGAPVGIAGFGLTAMDVMSALTVGRGGRYVEDPAGTMRYLPSGAEPELLFFSRTGLPCRARPRTMRLGPPYEPLVFTPAAVDALRAGRGPLDFTAELWPLLLTEIRVAYRRAQARLAGTDIEADLRGDLAGTLARLDRDDPFDPGPLWDPAPGMALHDADAYEKWLAGVVQADLAEGLLGLAGSPVKAGLDVLRALRDTFRHAVDYGGLTAASLEEFTTRTVPAVNRAVVGPQWERHAELLALLDAGIARVPFGPAPRVTGTRIDSTGLAEPYGREVAAVLAAQVPLPTVAASGSPLIRALHERGVLRPHRPGSRWVPGADVDRDQHPIGADGRPQRRLTLLGPLHEGATFYTNLVPSPGGFSRPVHDAHRIVAAVLGA